LTEWTKEKDRQLLTRIAHKHSADFIAEQLGITKVGVYCRAFEIYRALWPKTSCSESLVAFDRLAYSEPEYLDKALEAMWPPSSPPSMLQWSRSKDLQLIKLLRRRDSDEQLKLFLGMPLPALRERAHFLWNIANPTDVVDTSDCAIHRIRLQPSGYSKELVRKVWEGRPEEVVYVLDGHMSISADQLIAAKINTFGKDGMDEQAKEVDVTEEFFVVVTCRGHHKSQADAEKEVRALLDRNPQATLYVLKAVGVYQNGAFIKKPTKKAKKKK